MKAEPLKDKVVNKDNYIIDEDTFLHYDTDIKSAVEWLKERLDDKLSDLTMEQISYVRLLIYEAFPDIAEGNPERE